MGITHISSSDAPQPTGTYSQAVKANEFLFVSGQLPISPATNELVSEDPIAQIKQCFENIKAICKSGGAKLENAIKIDVYYADVTVSENINSVMSQYFSAPYPARIRVKVAALSKNSKVEIDGVFLCDG
jgi:reactive intermediate/imine deaminase